MKFTIKIIFIVLFFSTLLFSKDVGVITALNGLGHIERDGTKLTLSLGMKVQEKDSIVTQADAKVQIIFDDETIITVGKNSKFSINEYLFDEQEEEKSLEFGLLRGAMRTITGKIGKMAPEKFAVKTKTATIGIRGTNFTIVERGNEEIVYCTYGAITVTINNNMNLIKQGFFARVVDGSTSVQAFTPQELQGIKKANFVAKAPKKKKSSINSEKSMSKAVEAPQIDTTREILPTNEITAKHIVTNVRDSKQISEEEEHFHNDNFQDQIDTNPIIKEPAVGLTDMYGYAVFIDDASTLPGISGSFVSLLSSTSASNSIMSLYDHEYNGWQFTLENSTSGMTKDNFKTEFSSVKFSSGSTKNITNIRIDSSDFSASDDDLKSGDALTWGQWSASIVYDDNGINNQQKNFFGLWVAGERSPLDIAETFGSQKITYNGIYKAREYPQSGTIQGRASMDVDFGADTAELNILYGTGRSFIMGIYAGGSMSGYQNAISPNSGEYGYAYGLFYGKKGELIGGNFSTTSGGYESLELKGVFELSSESLATAVLDSNVRSGWLIDYTSQDYANHLQYETTPDKTFNPENSFIVLNELQSTTGDLDYWELQVDAQPLSYTSKEKFKGQFLSAYMIPVGSSKNAQIVDGNFVATGDDLANGDYMSWGSWNTKLAYENTDGLQEHQLSGFWQSGDPTPKSVVDAITGSDVSYSGIYRATNFTQQSNNTLNGEASLNVDFGADTAVLNINYSNGRVFDMTLEGNTLSGSLQGNEGQAYGTFYGPDASSVGGNFLTKDINGVDELRGVYQVTQ